MDLSGMGTGISVTDVGFLDWTGMGFLSPCLVVTKHGRFGLLRFAAGGGFGMIGSNLEEGGYRERMKVRWMRG